MCAVEDILHLRPFPGSPRTSPCSREVLPVLVHMVPPVGLAAEGSWLTKGMLGTFPPQLY